MISQNKNAPAALACSEEFDKLISVHVQELLKVYSTVGVFPEGPLSGCFIRHVCNFDAPKICTEVKYSNCEYTCIYVRTHTPKINDKTSAQLSWQMFVGLNEHQRAQLQSTSLRLFILNHSIARKGPNSSKSPTLI